MDTKDLYRFAKLEAERCTQEQGKNTSTWNQEHWWTWVTDKLVEHVKGEVCWQQFGAANFGILNSKNGLKDSILSRYSQFKATDSSSEEASKFYEELNGLLVA